MAEEAKNGIVISKKNSGFPDWLDFDKLRAEGIEYLGRLSGKIWTDHNVHDPGITILEMLCYALLDLGYRTNLPIEDIFTRNPEDVSADDNFFTAAQVLSCNPLTITDFRKLLVDIDGVKNAWLEVATDQVDICKTPGTPVSVDLDSNRDRCVTWLNGLYHVYIDLEKNPEKDFDNVEEREKYLFDVEDRIRKSLMKHRNFCEDFIDIFFLCKQEMGVCADIELSPNADPEQVYLSVIEKLREFFSPSPKYYTLQQLLDKEKPIEDIFAGRPYNITESHGFIDTEEFEQLSLRKEIHLSDLYNVLLSVEGIVSVRKLGLRISRNNVIETIEKWKFSITENHVPEFSMDYSGFRFTRNEMPVLVDFKKYEGLFRINFSHNGKILYQKPSPYLDAEIPKGVYRPDLGDYYSIQNEFPQVYGIGEGGLSDNAPASRKAEAYQLKAWLLFFDQLLANYLSQLRNIRSLFAFSGAKKSSDQHTYFINQLNSVPDLQKLLRFNITDNNKNSLGSEGSLLVFPVDREYLMSLKQQGKLESTDPSGLEPYNFSTKSQQDIVIRQVSNDFYYEQFQCEFVTRIDGCVYYYILTCSEEIVLVSRKYFKSIEGAKENAGSVKYIGTFDENYRSYINENKFSFNIELNLLSFSKYLQLIVEDRDLFIKRRQGFLDHLLSRFAEQFTAYAQLSFGFYSERELQNRSIAAKEKYLSGYDDLSSNRGRAYDYLQNNWNNDNISGFEKKVKAISGIDNWKKRSLCNFVVEKYEQQFAVELKIAHARYFADPENFTTEEEALASAQSLFNSMQDRGNYAVNFLPNEKEYQLKINYGNARQAVYPGTFATEKEAMELASRLSGKFRAKDPADTVFVSSYQYIPFINNAGGRTIRRSVEVYSSEKDALGSIHKTIKKIDDHKKWAYTDNETAIGNLYRDSTKSDGEVYINTDAFKIDISNTIVGRPDKFSYELLDKGNSFKFQSTGEFNTAADARSDAHWLLSLMDERIHYAIAAEDSTGGFVISIRENEVVKAVSSIHFTNEAEAENHITQVIGLIKNHQYTAHIEQRPHRWKFSFELGHDQQSLHRFDSVEDYGSADEAKTAASGFFEALPDIELEEKNKELALVLPKARKNFPVLSLVKTAMETRSTLKPAINNLLESEKEIKRLSSVTEPSAFRSSVAIDEVSRQGDYVYRLIDKDRVPAFYSILFNDRDSAKGMIAQVMKESRSADFLRICMGGDIISEIKDPVTNTKWYRYQVKSRNHVNASGHSLVLFESVLKFTDRKDAEAAFLKYYLEIISLASVKLNYGRKISLEEVSVSATGNGEAIVFVPGDTLKLLGTTTDMAVERLMAIALSFPVRKVVLASKEFNALFPCDQQVIEPEDDCRKKKETIVYYFSYPSAFVQANRWQSVKYYHTAEEAMADFEFFLVLLKYPGNYYVDCDHCVTIRSQYRIYIREVLAESAERFTSKQAAWGRDGVQKFICVSQSANAFHTYLNKRTCCYSFYVACSDSLFYHPCKYDTPAKRDEVMVALYQGARSWFKQRSWLPDTSSGEVTLLNGEGRSFAVLHINEKDQRCLSDQVADLSALVLTGTISGEEGQFLLRNERNETILHSEKWVKTKEEWKGMLTDFVCYYPVVKNVDEKTGKESYCIEIKLPGFENCSEEKNTEMPCGCGNKDVEDRSDCYIAWKSRCCYNTCAEAEEALIVIMRLLVNYEYYQAVYDCDCGPYGIAIQFSKSGIIRDQQLTYFREAANIRNWTNSEVVAINPQCYPYPEWACEASERAKGLINAEGLEVVEHILLRPRCIEDCRCDQYLKNCDETDCKFTWKVDDDDPCSEEEDICFVPGSDPYSFIATVALPAWPERFRKKENRKLIENILFQEAPAHVLLRILWLSPHDFCCFEGQYKNWNRWLAKKRTCIDDFSVCEFMEFLFDRNYECLEDCDVCIPCSDETTEKSNCFDDVLQQPEKNKYLSQINRLFCWQEQECKKYTFIECEKDEHLPADDVILLRAGRRPGEPADAVTPPPKKSAVAQGRKKPQVVNARMNKYRKSVAEVMEKSRSNALARKAQIFLADPKPGFERLSALVDETLKNKTSTADEGKPLTKPQSHILLEAGISYYLDRILFNGKDPAHVNELKKVFDKLRKAKISLKKIYQYFDLPELLIYEPSVREDDIKGIFDEK